MTMLKRKLEIEMKENKIQKMSESVVFDDHRNGQRVFNYKRKDQTAKKNLLAVVKRVMFEMEHKQKSTKIKFSAGAYLEAVLPTVRGWSDLNGKSFHFNGNIIQVSEFQAGYEENNKHFDSKIVFLTNGNRIVVHSYNSTQNMKVEGKGYLNFIEIFLEPYFRDILSKLTEKIKTYNKKVIQDFLKPQIRRSTRYKPVSEFRCKKCASNFGTHRQLTAHKAALHTGSFNSTGGSDAMSISEKLMIEDMSMTDISTIDTVEITPLDGSFFKCESCDFKTKFGNELWDHEGSDHREKVSESIPASVPKKSEELNVNIIDSEVIGKKEETAGRHRVEDVAADETEKINTGDENDKAAPEDEVIIEKVQEINAKGNTQDENDKAATAVSKDKVIIKEVQDLNAKGNSGDENDKAVTAGSKGEVIIEEVQELTTKVNVLPTEKITTLNGQREGNSASHTEIGEKPNSHCSQRLSTSSVCVCITPVSFSFVVFLWVELK